MSGRRQAVGSGRLRGGDPVDSTLTRHNGTSTQLFIFPYRNSTRTHLLTHQVPGWNRALILTGPHPRSRRPSCTPHHIPPSHLSTQPLHHTSIHRKRRPQPLMGIHHQPCGAAPNLPAAPPPPGRREGAAPLWRLGALKKTLW